MILDKIISIEEDVLEFVRQNFQRTNSVLLTYLNQNSYNIYKSNESYNNLLNNKFVVYSDGMAIYLVIKYILKKKACRFNATDLNQKILEAIEKTKLSVYLIGGNFDNYIINKKFYNKIYLLGYSNGYSDVENLEELVIKIKKTNPAVIILGLGVPKQEILANFLANRINCSLLICVGNFLEFYFGTKKRIPKILRNIGIEWIFRFITEPTRLWKRYIFGIPLFIYRIIKYKFHTNKIKTNI